MTQWTMFDIPQWYFPTSVVFQSTGYGYPPVMQNEGNTGVDSEISKRVWGRLSCGGCNVGARCGCCVQPGCEMWVVWRWIVAFFKYWCIAKFNRLEKECRRNGHRKFKLTIPRSEGLSCTNWAKETLDGLCRIHTNDLLNSFPQFTTYNIGCTCTCRHIRSISVTDWILKVIKHGENRWENRKMQIGFHFCLARIRCIHE